MRATYGQRNLLVDTAWWNTADQLALFPLLPPGQILLASDTPYGRPVAAAALVLRVALAAGLDDDQIAAVVGGQLERLLSGAEPLDLGPAPAATAPAPGALLVATGPPRRGPRVPGIHLLFVAAAVVRTPGVPLPEGAA